MTRPLPEIIRDLAVLAEREGYAWYRLAYLVSALPAEAVRSRKLDIEARTLTENALEAASILRRLDDGTLDIATLLDEPCTNLDAAREAYVAQYEAQLTAACRALAGVE